MEKLIYITILLSVIIWNFITIFRLDSNYDLNNLLIVLFNVTIVIVLINVPNVNKQRYIFKLNNLIIFSLSMLISAFTFPYMEDIFDKHKTFNLRYNSISDFNTKLYQISITASLFFVVFTSNLMFQRGNRKSKQYMRIYLFVLTIMLISCFIVISNNIDNNTIHIHHFAVGFAIAICNISNHPLAILTLGSSMGVMIEGLSMYGWGPTIYKPTKCGKLYSVNQTLMEYTEICCNLPRKSYLSLCVIDNIPLTSLSCSAN